MANKDTKTDYQEVVMAWGPKRRNGRKYSQLESFCFFDIHIHYFLYIQGIFKSHLKKITQLKKPIPTQNPNLT